MNAAKDNDTITELRPHEDEQLPTSTSSLVADLVEALKAPGRRTHKLKTLLSIVYRFGAENARLLPGIKRSFLWIFGFEVLLLIGLDVIIYGAIPLYAWVPMTILSSLVAMVVGALTYLQLGLVKRDDGTPHRWFLLPNSLSLLRILLLPHLFFMIIYMEHNAFAALLALILYAYSASSDALDGNLSRILDQQSVFGRIYDPIFDIIFNSSVALSLAMAKVIPLWMASLIFTRYWLPIFGGFFLYLYHKPFIIMPTGMGKVTGFVLAVVMGAPILQAATVPPTPPDEVIFYGIVVAGILVLINSLYIVYRGVKFLSEDAPEA